MFPLGPLQVLCITMLTSSFPAFNLGRCLGWKHVSDTEDHSWYPLVGLLKNIG